MLSYGIVLQNYKKNDELLNEAIFTMMHHIIGEVENTTVLFQPIIMKTFLNIYAEKDYLYEVRIKYIHSYFIVISILKNMILKYI